MHRRGDGGILVHLHEIFPRFYRFAFLSQATKVLPLGTAYAIWTGIGALGALIAGIILFKEPAAPARLFFAALLLVGILGLKATSGH